ncbi:DsbA family protein [Aquihabitans sp. McL0605]|uniref:DsbA family protein n=1 Tax=Aquihabitans sp. McL0605 TaxID=3415671 RepID=UPI003CE98B5E
MMTVLSDCVAGVDLREHDRCATAPAGGRDPVRIGVGDHVLGSAHGVLKTVIYGDLTSPATMDVYLGVRDAVLRDEGVTCAFRHRLTQPDPVSRIGANFAEVAAHAGLFWPFVDAVATCGCWGTHALRHLRALGVEDELLTDPDVRRAGRARLIDDAGLASAARARTDPSVFINGVPWSPGRGRGIGDDLARLAGTTRPLWDQARGIEHPSL